VEPDAAEIRVVGCLVEKQRATPDQYPLTLNALRLACNQSTNRDPVVHYDEPTVRAALDRLGRRGWTTLASWSTARSVKYKHLLDQALGVESAPLSLLAVLMLRGPQTAGELRQRAERLHRFESNDELERTLNELADRELVAPLPRRAGERGQRWAHLLADEAEVDVTPPASTLGPAPPTEPGASSGGEPGGGATSGAGLDDRVARLEHQVVQLREQLAALRDELGV